MLFNVFRDTASHNASLAYPHLVLVPARGNQPVLASNSSAQYRARFIVNNS